MRPATEEQWRNAVDAADLLARITTAQVLLFLEMGKLFNLVDEDGEIDIEACCEVIEDAHRLGIISSADAIRRFITGR
jgi:hypothetical protein